MSVSRVEADQIIRALTGGNSPNAGDAPIFNSQVGWQFKNISDIVTAIIEAREAETRIQPSILGAAANDPTLPGSIGQIVYSQLPRGSGTWDTGAATDTITFLEVVKFNYDVKFVTAKKVYWDGGTDNYSWLVSEGPDIWEQVVGGTSTVKMRAGLVQIAPIASTTPLAIIEVGRPGISSFSNNALHAGDDGGDTVASAIVLSRANASASTLPFLQMEHYRGSHASITATQSGDILGEIRGGGALSGARSGTVARFRIIAEETYSSSSNLGSGIALRTIPIGSGTEADMLYIQGDKIGLFGQTPQDRLSFTVTNGTDDTSYDANATTVDELADVLYTLLKRLTAAGGWVSGVT